MARMPLGPLRQANSHLTDVDDLGGPVTDAMYPQQTQGLRVENQFQEAVGPTEHLTLC